MLKRILNPYPCAQVSLALFGAYITRAGITIADSSILDPEVCAALCCSARGRLLVRG